MEDFKTGYVPNASQRIQELVEKQAARQADFPTDYEILNYVFNGDANTVTVLAGYVTSWFRLEFSFLTWITLANNMNFQYKGVYVPDLVWCYSGNYSAVATFDSYDYVVEDDMFYLDGIRKGLPAQLTCLPLYSRVDTGRIALPPDSGFDPFEI